MGMTEYLAFWIAKFLIEGSIFLCGIIVVGMIVLLLTRPGKMFCKHDQGVWEDWACNAVCRKCGRKLGFIGLWRDRK